MTDVILCIGSKAMNRKAALTTGAGKCQVTNKNKVG